MESIEELTVTRRESPLYHNIRGWGWPVTRQENLAGSPSRTVIGSGTFTKMGGSASG